MESQNHPIIIDDGGYDFHDQFHDIYPTNVFIDHEMRVHAILDTMHTAASVNVKIQEMLDNMPDDVYGCPDPDACNYNPNVTIDDGSCEYYDCAGECGGSKIEDECGVCDGYGGCDCVDGDISCDCCCPEEQERDCSGVCRGPALDDECGICIDPVCNSSGTPSPFTAGKNPCQLEGEYPISTLWNSTCDFLSLNNISIPNYFKISNLYPNPFNPVLNIDFEISQTGWIKVNIADITGSMVKTVYEGYEGVGKHHLSWDSGKLPSGTYFVNLDFDNLSLTKKVVLLK